MGEGRRKKSPSLSSFPSTYGAARPYDGKLFPYPVPWNSLSDFEVCCPSLPSVAAYSSFHSFLPSPTHFHLTLIHFPFAHCPAAPFHLFLALTYIITYSIMSRQQRNFRTMYLCTQTETYR